MERYNFNLLAHYTFSDAFEPFVEAKWNRVNALGYNAGPSFIQGTYDPVRLPRARPARQSVPDAGAADDDRQRDPGLGLQHQPDRGLHRDDRPTGGTASADRSPRRDIARSTPAPSAS